MKNSKKIALSAVISALGVVVLFLGGLLGILDISSACIVSFFVLFIEIEIGKTYSILAYVVISVLGFLLCGENLFAPACFTFFFGPMAITKSLFEKCGKALSWILKLALPSLILFFIWLFGKELLQLPETTALKILYFALSIVTAFLTQVLYIRLTRLYLNVFRKRIEKFLK